MDKKGSRKRRRSTSYNKKHFQGNQHTSETGTNFTSTSAKKLRASTFDKDDVPVRQDHSYRILNFITVFQAVSTFVCCKVCKEDVTFYEKGKRGLGSKICLSCVCGEKEIPSSPFIDKAYEVNRRIVFVMRLLGIGVQGVDLFCGLMDLCSGLSRCTYYACLPNISTASEAMYKLSTERAIAEERKLTEKKTGNSTNLSVSGDGTWKKRGFSSLLGVTTLIGKHCGKVVDSVVKCSFCRACINWTSKRGTPEYDAWHEDHQENCTINHSGSAGKMEVDSMKEMFSRSMELHGVQYTTYIGDGDSKTFKAIVDLNPYGDDVTVVKKECVGHVEKRMGTRLRALKKKTKGLGGKGVGKLTDKLILDLTKYYGLAIRRNAHDKEEMRKAVWATFYHKSSTNDEPRHDDCCGSWCDWKKAEANGTLETFMHKAPLDEKVQEAIKTVYEDLSNDALLERCVGANSQNNNESLNSLIWTFSPKHIYSGKTVVQIASNLATVIFNDGFLGVLHIMNVMGIRIGHNAFEYCTSRNENRLLRSEHRASTASKEARSAAREEAVLQNDLFEEEEGVLYGAGIAD